MDLLPLFEFSMALDGSEQDDGGGFVGTFMLVLVDVCPVDGGSSMDEILNVECFFCSTCVSYSFHNGSFLTLV